MASWSTPPHRRVLGCCVVACCTTRAPAEAALPRCTRGAWRRGSSPRAGLATTRAASASSRTSAAPLWCSLESTSGSSRSRRRRPQRTPNAPSRRAPLRPRAPGRRSRRTRARSRSSRPGTTKPCRCGTRGTSVTRRQRSPRCSTRSRRPPLPPPPRRRRRRPKTRLRRGDAPAGDESS